MCACRVYGCWHSDELYSIDFVYNNELGMYVCVCVSP